MDGIRLRDQTGRLHDKRDDTRGDMVESQHNRAFGGAVT